VGVLEICRVPVEHGTPSRRYISDDLLFPDPVHVSATDFVRPCCGVRACLPIATTAVGDVHRMASTHCPRELNRFPPLLKDLVSKGRIISSVSPNRPSLQHSEESRRKAHRQASAHHRHRTVSAIRCMSRVRLRTVPMCQINRHYVGATDNVSRAFRASPHSNRSLAPSSASSYRHRILTLARALPRYSERRAMIRRAEIESTMTSIHK
jgi:hypothetical protein